MPAHCTRRDICLMDDRAPHLDVLQQIETRHEDLLARLDELDKRVAEVLKEWQGGCQAADSGGN